ncbi:hypothetical protein P4S72_07695 [Vibrio sp. PP-XX7]
MPQLCAYNVGFSITLEAALPFEHDCWRDGEFIEPVSLDTSTIEKTIRTLMARHAVLRCCFLIHKQRRSSR